MDIQKAQQIIRNISKTGFVATSRHCRERMLERNVIMDDILNVLLWGNVNDLEENQDSGEWKCKVEGMDLDDDELTLIVAFDVSDQSVLCVTVY
jgi:Domain of unknown function (DUF4258)